MLDNFPVVAVYDCVCNMNVMFSELSIDGKDPEFLQPLQITKTRAGMQVTTLHLCTYPVFTEFNQVLIMLGTQDGTGQGQLGHQWLIAYST